MTAASVLGWFSAHGRKPPPGMSPPTASANHLLHKRLEHARLEKMLQRMHVSPDVYLQRLHADQLREQLDTCAACPHVFLCDQALGRPSSVDVDLSFCPNRDQITAEWRGAASRAGSVA